MRESFWQNNRMVTHMLFDLCLSKHFSPVADFGDQSLEQLEFILGFRNMQEKLLANYQLFSELP